MLLTNAYPVNEKPKQQQKKHLAKNKGKASMTSKRIKADYF